MKTRTTIKLILVALTGATLLGYGMFQPEEVQQEYLVHTFEKMQLSSTFYAEGGGIGDLNGDGQLDVICGPYWYEGPAFTESHAYYEPVEFDPLHYSDRSEEHSLNSSHV